MAKKSEQVSALFVVYDADGTHIGELLYMLRKLLGIAHCAACDITHGPRREKPEFTRLKSVGWNVPLYNIHRNEMDHALRTAVEGNLPAVAARTLEGGNILLLGPKQLDDCDGSVSILETAINAALAGASLSTPPFPPHHPNDRIGRRKQPSEYPASLQFAVAGTEYNDLSSENNAELGRAVSSKLNILQEDWASISSSDTESHEDHRLSKRRKLPSGIPSEFNEESQLVGANARSKKPKQNSLVHLSSDSDDSDAVVPLWRDV